MVWRTAVLVLCFLLYTQVSTESLRLLNCSEEVDGVSYLKADYNINCASPKRRAFAVAASVTLAVFSLGLPAMSACILWRAQRGASSPSGEGVESLAFLTNGFKPQYRYWECIQMLRKFLIVAVAVLWSGAIDGLQVSLNETVAAVTTMATTMCGMGHGCATVCGCALFSLTPQPGCVCVGSVACGRWRRVANAACARPGLCTCVSRPASYCQPICEQDTRLVGVGSPRCHRLLTVYVGCRRFKHHQRPCD